MSDLIGSRVSHYQILGLLGAGGMGAVYRAHDERLDRDLALKVLPETSIADETDRARLMLEARTASSLQHPCIAHVYEVGEDSGRDFIAMELVEGKTLRKSIPPSGFPTEAVYRYGLQIAAAIAYAHEHGVIHRDLKSSNIMLTDDGWVKIVDFGLAKRVPDTQGGQAPPSLGLTSTGTIVGTLDHLSPEVLGGAAATPASDVWALGVVLYQMATGRLPFRAANFADLAHAIVHDPPLPLGAKVPAGLRGVIERCLAKEPSQRYRNAGELRAALESVRKGDDREAMLRIVRWSAVAVAALAILAFAWTRTRPSHETVPPATAAPVATPSQASTVRPMTARASLLRITSDGEKPLALNDAVKPGDALALDYQCDDSSYVYVFDEDDKGHTYVLFPLAGFATRNPLAGGASIRLPGILDGRDMIWTVTNAGGGEAIYVFASRTRQRDLETELARAPSAHLPGAPGYPRVGPRVMLALRGIGGLAPAPETNVPSASRLRELFPELMRRAEKQTDLWLWQTRLRSLATAAAR